MSMINLPPATFTALALLVYCLGATSSATAQPAAKPVSGTSVPCERWAILAPGGGSGGALSVCSSILQDVPALRAEVARLNAMAERNDDVRRDLQRFGETLNAMSRQMKGQDVNRLANAVATRLGRTGGGDESLNEVDRLRLGMRELNNKLDSLRAAPGMAARVDGAVAGDAGAAIARLDFESAKNVLDGLRRIESKIDDAQGPYAADPRLLALVRNEALARLESARAANAERLCTKGWQALLTLRTAAESTERQGKVNAAGLSYKEMADRATQIANELTMQVDMKRAEADTNRQLAELQTGASRQSYDSALGMFESRRKGALAHARTDVLRQGIARADAMRQQAQGLAAQQDYLNAADLLIDGANLLGRVESQGGNYRMPLDDIRKTHRTGAMAQLARTQANTAAAPAGTPPGMVGACQ